MDQPYPLLYCRKPRTREECCPTQSLDLEEKYSMSMDGMKQQPYPYLYTFILGGRWSTNPISQEN
nr:hypothetical protein Q903MT_gene6503 [Picea sitchensis]